MEFISAVCRYLRREQAWNEKPIITTLEIIAPKIIALINISLL
jgi:hypothetical protein